MGSPEWGAFRPSGRQPGASSSSGDRTKPINMQTMPSTFTSSNPGPAACAERLNQESKYQDHCRSARNTEDRPPHHDRHGHSNWNYGGLWGGAGLLRLVSLPLQDNVGAREAILVPSPFFLPASKTVTSLLVLVFVLLLGRRSRRPRLGSLLRRLRMLNHAG